MIGDGYGYGYGDGYGETEGPRFDDTSRAEAHRELMAIARVLAEGLGLIEDGEDRTPFLDEIRQEMKKVRKVLEDSHAASEAMREQAQAYLEAQQAKTQEYLDQVQIEPEPDFYPFIELPMGDAPAGTFMEEGEDWTSPDTSAKSYKTILYIEDEPMNRELVVACVSGYEWIDLQTAKTAEEGLELAEQIKPDLILLDILLPGMDGFTALVELKKNLATQNIPVIALTAQAMKDDIERIKQARFDDYLTKPVQMRVLRETLLKHL